MGGSAIEKDWEFASPLNEARTVVLVGRTGNGKSSTGNSILGRRAFKSSSSSAGVTSTCELHTTLLDNGQMLNVIDTPGLFDFSDELEVIGREIVKCISMAKDGIHALLVILSVRSRFSREEEAAIESLRKFFGTKISDYMIVVFTGGDDLEENGETLYDYLGRDCPEPLKETLEMCGNRYVLFDNRTKNAGKKSGQLKQLYRLVDAVVCNNGGKPYTNELFVELKKGAVDPSTFEEQLKRITDQVESKLRETIRKLREILVKAEKDTAELRSQAQKGKCVIM